MVKIPLKLVSNPFPLAVLDLLPTSQELEFSKKIAQILIMLGKQVLG